MEIITQALSFFIGKKQIVKNIEMQIKDKEFVGIIGPNGSGKSSFLKCVYRTQKPSHGDIFFQGKNIKDISYRESALQVAVVAQHNFYNFDFTVNEVVLMGRTPHKKLLQNNNLDDYKLVQQVLTKVGLNDFQDRMFNTLSGGEQQRVILARALVQQTPCLILDEPTNHLDIRYQLELLDIVKELNITILAAIHDLNIAAMYCDRLIAFKDGSIVGSGTPEELLTADFIHFLYGVNAVVNKDDASGIMNITYLPKHCSV